MNTQRSLTRGAEMEARLLDLARQGLDDATIAARLTSEGHRSARRGSCPRGNSPPYPTAPSRAAKQRRTHPRHIPGWLTMAELARRLQVSRNWIERRIRNGTISIVRDAATHRLLFPDTDDTLASFTELKAGAVDPSTAPSKQTNEGINMTDRSSISAAPSAL